MVEWYVQWLNHQETWREPGSQNGVDHPKGHTIRWNVVILKVHYKTKSEKKYFCKVVGWHWIFDVICCNIGHFHNCWCASVQFFPNFWLLRKLRSTPSSSYCTVYIFEAMFSCAKVSVRDRAHQLKLDSCSAGCHSLSTLQTTPLIL